jgi:large subunit ribosomal protein L30
MAVTEKKPAKPAEKKVQAPKKKTESAEKQLRIQLVRSLVGRPRKQREVVKGLGLRRINSEVVRKDCPEIRGMVNKIPHLVKVDILEKK